MMSLKQAATHNAGELKAKRSKEKLIFRKKKIEIVKCHEGEGANFITRTLQLPPNPLSPLSSNKQ
ncbi:hypothetical protein E2C01_068854 [Portunus trituberculatus]|uniref:Uncharacterized protein n=1 Tax=Portunus trituberculatus TaxID=210409 RepID=A0A5B7I189_PORTR|nr:hypothetical protein [Portunus trituberculatus]